MSLHEDAGRVLADFQHSDPAQQRLALDYRNFLDEHDDAVFRECRIGHVTASALVVDPLAQQVLLTLHPKVGRWLQLGGHIEARDATVREAAVREVIEECGLDSGHISTGAIRLDRHPVPCGRDEDGNPLASEHLDVQFLVVVPEVRAPIISVESDDLRWFDHRDLPPIDASVQALVDDARAFLSAVGITDPDRWVTFG